MSLNLSRGVIALANSKDNVYINNDSRIVYLSEDIDNESLGAVNFNILHLIEQDNKKEEIEIGFVRKPIKLYINSYGGSIYDMWGLIDIIRNSETPVYTYCTGYAMSAAFLIFIAGHKRFISDHVSLLYHQASHWRRGTYQSLLEDGEERDWIQNTIELFVKSRTKIKQSRLDTVRKNKIDWYIHADEAIELGIADEII